MPKKLTILIAGGAGFLGSHLCDYYLSRGATVVCVDNLATGFKANIKHIPKSATFHFFNWDIVKPLPAEVIAYDYDFIANLASPASPPQYQRLAIETLMVGATGTLQLLDLAQVKQARFFHASTSEVYGDPDVHPQPESYHGSVNSYGPRSMYDESKRFAEALIYSYRRKYGLSTSIARFFNTYGPRMDPNDGRVVSNFIVQALKGQPLTIYGDGKQTRSFCYVDDLIDGIGRLISSSEEGPINLGNPSEFTMLELAQIVQELTATKNKLQFKSLPVDDPLQRQPVIDKAKLLLDWQPKVNLRKGLQSTINYFKTIV